MLEQIHLYSSLFLKSLFCMLRTFVVSTLHILLSYDSRLFTSRVLISFRTILFMHVNKTFKGLKRLNKWKHKPRFRIILLTQLWNYFMCSRKKNFANYSKAVSIYVRRKSIFDIAQWCRMIKCNIDILTQFQAEKRTFCRKISKMNELIFFSIPFAKLAAISSTTFV